MDIFSYLDVGQYLNVAWQTKKQTNPSFSMRSWSQYLGMKHHGSLQQILNGERPLPKKYLPKLIKSLNLDVNQGLYLETLVDLNRSRDDDEKEMYLERLKSLSPSAKLQMLEVETYRYLKNPLHAIVLEMTAQKDFKYDLAKMQKKLLFKVSLNELENIIDRLIALGLLKEEKGKLIKTYEHLNSRLDVEDKALQEYHQNCSNLARELITVQPLEKREYNAGFLNIDPAKMPLAKKKIRAFLDDFIKCVEAKPDQGKETYQLNIQFFAITNTKEN